MDNLTTWFALGTLGMFVGTLALAYGYRLIPEENYGRYSILVAVPAIAVGAYALMALGFGAVETQRGNTVFLWRYVDWLLTTPLHVLYLGLLAGAAMGTIYRSIGLMAATIVLGFAGAIAAPPLKWPLFLAGSTTFAGVVYYAYYDFDDAAAAGDDQTLGVFRKLRAFLVVLWLLYPVIWLLAPIGFGFMNLGTTALVISYLDVVAKVGFGLIALSGLLAFSTAAAGSEAPAD